MKLLCKSCSAPLTTDLYPTKSWGVYVDESLEEGDYGRISFFATKGSFWYSRLKRYWGVKCEGGFLINPDNFKGVVPEYQSGMGCCGVHGEDVHCKGCGEEVGVAYLDCYDSKHVRISEPKVVRRYK